MIAAAVLPHRIEIHPLLGTDGEGTEVYGPALVQFSDEGTPARLYEKRRAVAGPNGTVFVTTQACQVQPLDVDAVGALVTDGARTWTVAEVEHASLLNRPHHEDLVLTGERKAVPA